MTDRRVPKGAPVFGQTEIFGKRDMTMMNKQSRMTKAFAEGRMIRRMSGQESPVENFRPRDVLIHDWVYEGVEHARCLQEIMMDAKRRAFEEFDLMCDLLMEHYGARIGGTRGGAELESIDRLLKVQITTTDQKTVTPAIIAAEELVREVMDDLMDGASADLRQIVDRAFSRNRQTGQISTARIVSLVTMEIEHPKWPAAQRALREAIDNSGQRRYMRFYQRAEARDPWQLIDLNYSSLEV
ncbi:MULTISPECIES: DUF3164 family protein [unclassified Saccharibacter]|uniref:DUF3164 family protein n=1 Tax=unclassified Saccharibacter TaxID=2648722 RepID=UPI0013299263|nr:MULTISPECIES: DUF3164 family protein [unclassified Saccharibacter]MXV35807.1 DUF3164 family protein [Saccharibacter sp. EH611]MXV57928.1 DUF3164 family protein [Saccharibacter sp. EH70]MXV66323.1 DUF3164 family protein [Saccharibacter sp. EH60]